MKPNEYGKCLDKLLAKGEIKHGYPSESELRNQQPGNTVGKILCFRFPKSLDEYGKFF